MTLTALIVKKFISSKKNSKFLSFISLISILGIALGVAVVIISLTILDGFDSVVKEKIFNFRSHIYISAYGDKNLPDSKEIETRIKETCGAYYESISPFISKLGIIRSSKSSDGVTISGIPVSHGKGIKEYIVSGNFDINESNSVVIGKKLAEKLFIKVGDRITLFSLKKDQVPSAANPPAIEQFFVKGIYSSGMAEYDDRNVFINITAAKEFFEMPNEISGYNLRLNDIAKIESIADAVHSSLRYPYYARSIYQIHSNIFTWLELQKKPIPIILGLIVLVAVFNIVGTLLMFILEKTSEIGILKTLGMKKKNIIRIFMYNGIYIALVGIIIGNLTALVLSLLQQKYDIISLPDTVYFLSSVPISINLFNYLLVSAFAFILSFAASIIPSYVAAKIKPISAIRFE
jgi:lipoprotein-releasing system permease protein